MRRTNDKLYAEAGCKRAKSLSTNFDPLLIMTPFVV